MNLVLTFIICIYALLQLYACVVRWRLIPTTAFIWMIAGSVTLFTGGIWHFLSAGWAGHALIITGLLLISYGTCVVGIQRAAGPNYQHHILRAVIALMLIGATFVV